MASSLVRGQLPEYMSVKGTFLVPKIAGQLIKKSLFDQTEFRFHVEDKKTVLLTCTCNISAANFIFSKESFITR